MPQKNSSSRRMITPLLLFTLAGWALWALGRGERAEAAGSGSDSERGSKPVESETRRPARASATWSKRRLATSLAFATLFFAGAAFSAGAGDVVAEALEGATTSELVSTEAEPVEEPILEEQVVEEQVVAEVQAVAEETVEEQSAEAEEELAEGEQPAETGEGSEGGQDEGDSGQEQPEQGGGGSGGDQPSSDPDSSAGSGDGSPGGSGPQQPSGGQGGQPADEAPDPAPHLDEGDVPAEPSSESETPLLGKAPAGPTKLDPEATVENVFATVWLHRTMPDPTPPARRLTPLFAKTLAREASRADLEWSLLLGVLRAQGFDGGSTSTTRVRRVADRLVALGVRRDAWRALLAFQGRTAFADRAQALVRYNRAVGLQALVVGLQAAKPGLQQKVLGDSRLHIYPGGRLDIALGRIDVRVLVLLEYLAEAHGSVTVSSLFSGHRLYARPGVVSAHVYGLAVDIAALGGASIAGNQGPSGLTERAVRNILLLPAELQPRQVISLLGLGEPSIPLADHWDHIHVGY